MKEMKEMLDKVVRETAVENVTVTTEEVEDGWVTEVRHKSELAKAMKIHDRIIFGLIDEEE